MDAHDVEVLADYHQFYLWDAGMGRQAPEDYSDADVRRMVKVGDHVVVVQPVRNTTVPVRVEVHENDPVFDPDAWDHIAELSLALPTGALEVHESTGGPVLNVQLAPGTYRVRALFAGLGELSADGLEGKDRYHLQLWPGEASELRIVKQRAD